MSMNMQWRGERLRRLPAVLLVLALMAGCGYLGYLYGHRSAGLSEAGALPLAGSEHGAGALSTKARAGRSFRNDSFRITVTKAVLHRTRLAVSHGHPYRPVNGQFVIVYVRAKNVGKKPAMMSATASQLVDAQGRSYDAGVYLRGAGQGLDRSQQPGTSATGWFAFDVPNTVRVVSAVLVQPDENLATSNLPTRVSLGPVA